ncbi:hypothetical protein C0Q70_17764 [Pomacea canaliculata]|uniref:Uncharacterized protein n=1 Tax=Pomacea canaliculata TaxID=400727 RepID=A0A2T7NLC4_POMCA|nr:hypothetical protein C0Q70_17764 [Pomacea canaliculata]
MAEKGMCANTPCFNRGVQGERMGGLSLPPPYPTDSTREALLGPFAGVRAYLSQMAHHSVHVAKRGDKLGQEKEEDREAKKVEEEKVGLVSVREGATNLQNSLGQSRLLCQLLEVFGVGVVVEGEVGLHGPQLVMLEARAHALLSWRGVAVPLTLQHVTRHV